MLNNITEKAEKIVIKVNDVYNRIKNISGICSEFRK